MKSRQVNLRPTWRALDGWYGSDLPAFFYAEGVWSNRNRMRNKFVNWVKDNRFLIVLSFSLISGMFLSFIFGKNPDENIAISLRNFLSNLASEIAGALISVWIISSLLNRHQEHSLRDVRHLLSDSVRLSVYETANKAIGSIAKPQYEIVNLSEFNDLLHSILECHIKEARTQLEDLTDKVYYPPLDPIAYSDTRNMARVQQREWADLQIRFMQYLHPNQFTICTKIIEHLKNIYKESGEVENSIHRAGKTEQILLASQLAPVLISEIKELTKECLDLLETTFE
ncbi:MAG: hypothetical protein KJZ77_15775 [Anaerolineales bacterium]|nr:hypothetical protein [Anaerolineales bacterium]